ncbi:MAG: hypothetical protein R2856_09515 [Caldilineaceae bacterium]
MPHGNFSGSDPDESVIKLADQMELYPRDLRGSFVRGLRRARPLVFLNACHTAQIGFSLTGLGGWAERCWATCAPTPSWGRCGGQR